MEEKNIHWLPEEEYKKAVGQLRLQINGILGQTFNMYGLGDAIPGATSAIVKLAEDFGLRVRGEDHPIQVHYVDRFGRGLPDD